MGARPYCKLFLTGAKSAKRKSYLEKFCLPACFPVVLGSSAITLITSPTANFFFSQLPYSSDICTNDVLPSAKTQISCNPNHSYFKLASFFGQGKFRSSPEQPPTYIEDSEISV